MLALLLALAATAAALPAPFPDLARPLAPRDLGDLASRSEGDLTAEAALAGFIAYFPRISSPAKGDVFTAGGALEVAWNNTKPAYPENQIHQFAQVFLGFLDDADPSSGYNLDVDHPLGNVSFYGGSGTASLPLPADLPTRSTYLITMGSTANISPLFTIEGAESSNAASSSSAASAAPATTSSAPQIEERPITVYFPDGDSTVLGGHRAASTSSSDAAAAAATATGLRDINAAGDAAPSSSAAVGEDAPLSATVTSSAPATTAEPTSSTATASASDATLAAAEASTPTSGATKRGAALASSAVLGLAGIVAAALV